MRVRQFVRQQSLTILFVAFVSGWHCCCVQRDASGQETELADSQATSDVDQAKARFQAIAERIRLQAETDPTEAKLLDRPVLNWTNPVRKTPSGAMFLWVDARRPVAALCLYPASDEATDHEFQSLALEKLVASVDDRIVWQPNEAGLKFGEITGAAPPSDRSFVRMRQMKSLAREFQAKLVPPDKHPISLRLLATPLHRYPAEARMQSSGDRDLIDGAVFALVQGTDPEVLLLIEAREQSGQTQWVYALARMSMVPTEVRRAGQLVWSTDWAIQRTYTTYYTAKGL
ncbi:MAG: hypothetical protein AAGA03_06525 [Planctomycetota bacterium]